MAQAKARLSELALRTGGGERFRLLRRGRPVAALVPVEDLNRIDEREKAMGLIEAARRFAASLPADLPDLADILPARSSRGRQRRR